jgi:uncharacterized protein YodC (DUF2158 family)
MPGPNKLRKFVSGCVLLGGVCLLSSVFSSTAAALYIGERVKLKSGGPWMTVESVSGDEVMCVWFGGFGALLSGKFQAWMLRSMDLLPPR